MCSDEAHAPRTLGGVDKAQREEMVQQGNRRKDAHHCLTNESKYHEKSDGFRTQVHHVDLIMGKYIIEEVGKGGNQSRPQGIGKVPNLGGDPVDGEARRGPGRRPPTFIEDGGQGRANLAQALLIDYDWLIDGGGRRR